MSVFLEHSAPFPLKKKLSVFIFKGGISPIMHFSQLSFAEKAFVCPPFSGDICTRSEIPGSETFLTSTWKTSPHRLRAPTVSASGLPSSLSPLLSVRCLRPPPRPPPLAAFRNVLLLFHFLHVEYDMSGHVSGGIFALFGIFWVSWICDLMSLIWEIYQSFCLETFLRPLLFLLLPGFHVHMC